MEIIEIPFGAKDSELQEWTYTIPKGMKAEIRDGKVIIKKKKSKDEQIMEALISYMNEIRNTGVASFNGFSIKEYITYLEKQKINTEGDFGRGYDCGYKACLNSHGAEFFEKQKEQKPVDLEKEIEKAQEHYFALKDKGFSLDSMDVSVLARHFYELGRKGGGK